MSKKSGESAPLLIVFLTLGVGLVFIALLELSGLMTYKPFRQPIGAPVWLSAGLICLVIAAVIGRWRK